ncbi:MAG: endonuclease domain-containing protein [candidate division Zixibacteria bacterium]|nr:endonuclease domain-containing protein [candidate division Zixibacteria bacterium]
MESNGELDHRLSLEKNKIRIPLRKGKLLRQRRYLRKNMTPAEKELWQKIKSKQLGGFKFRRQHHIGRFVVDFYCPRASLVVEVDGNTHLINQKLIKDEIRQKRLEKKGLIVKRYTNNEVRKNLDGVLLNMLETCRNLTHSLSLKRRGLGRG